VVEREIARIIWHERGHAIEVVYADGEPDQVVGAQIVAAQLAESVGLTIVGSAPGTICWVRDDREPRSTTHRPR
jgi:hypothetical protein